jgi:hypothetical protein
MKEMSNSGERNFLMELGRILMALFLASAISLVSFSAQAEDHEDWKGKGACAKTSRAALNACYKSAQETLWVNIGKCDNVTREDKKECLADAKTELRDSLSECREVFDARQEVCDAVGPGPYLPEEINPDDFEEEPSGNDYFPLTPGTKYTYKLYSGGDILETIVVEVKDETREIEDVTCRVVQDMVYEGNSQVEEIEDTTDWYALHSNGDVWYFG